MHASKRHTFGPGLGGFALAVALATAWAAGCDGTAEPGDLEMTESALGTAKPSTLAKRFRIIVNGPLLVDTRAGETLEVPLTTLQLEVAAAPTARRGQAPVTEVMVPPAPARRAQPVATEVEVPCPSGGTATRARPPAIDVNVPPETPDDNVARRARVPVIDVVPMDPNTPAIATRVRVPVMEITPPGNPKKVKRVVVPEITIGLSDPGGPAIIPTRVFATVPDRSADAAKFASVPAKKPN